VSPSNPLARSNNRNGFIERTLVAINHSLEQSIFAENIARQNGLLQELDPRLKLIAMLLLLLAVNFSRQVSVIFILYLFSLILALTSKVPLGIFMKRIWGFVLLFTGIVAIPALFITAGPPLIHLPMGFAITQTGALTVLFLLLRTGTSVSFAVLFMLCTRWNNILKAMGVLRIPDVFILVLGMTYRYIHLLLHLTNDMFLSRKSRILRRMQGAEERNITAATATALLGKSLQVSSEVFLAMESRGYREYPRTMDSFQMSRLDWISFLVVSVITGAAIWAGR
jgi:cobalt/nickel transport system permease protein